jgi:dTMP kinase
VTEHEASAGRGRFITIEGPEGSGKSTQARRLEEHLAADGIDVIRTREPGGTRLGEEIRRILLAAGEEHRAIDPLADALLFSAARRQLVAQVIRPALARGTSVVCARFADSTLAYQGYGAGIPLELLRELESVATGGLRPSLTILLDLPPDAGLARKPAADQTRFELGFDIAFHERVRAGFLELAAEEPERFAVVDARPSADDVWTAVRRAVDGAASVHGPAGGEAPAGEPDAPAERIHR